MGKGSNTEKRIEELIAPILDQSGFELVYFEFFNVGQNCFLWIYADKNGVISIDDC